ncbi:MAG: hypothetical protein EZS28_048987 [Streblomastix strix]|uniref:Uncharacterized protein n=1 Tax=Streblomastix strix TaxID=222440 RepID=A0A5J4TAT0_9EUKA|nr:MAG: hypothetical protein EZS28_048987 [Streblomastix strix]
MQDLLKGIKVIPCQNGWCFIIKEYDCIAGKNTIKYKSRTALQDQHRTNRFWQDGKKHIAAIDSLEQYHSQFEKLGIKIVSQNPKIFSIFQGYQYIQNASKKTENVTDIDGKVDRFNAVIENKMFAITNEMKNCGDARMSNIDTLKINHYRQFFLIE